MSWKSLGASISAVSAKLADVSDRATAAGNSVKFALSEMKMTGRNAAMDALEAGAAGALWTLWLQLVAFDANDPGLPKLEALMRQYSGADISFLAQVKSAARKAQQKKFAAAGPRGRTKASGALSEDELQALLNEYTGPN